jgi:hypothetical protein
VRGDVPLSSAKFNGTAVGHFEILRSNANYAKWTRTFASEYVASDGLGLGQSARAGAFPVEGVGILAFSRPAIYFPHSGTLIVQWDVAGNATPSECLGIGGNDWFPVGGFIDRDADWRTDAIVFGGATDGTAGFLKMKKSGGATCAGATTTKSSIFWDSNRIRPSAPFDQITDLAGGVYEWTSGCNERDCTIQGGYFLEKNASCKSGGFTFKKETHPTIGFRCCADAIESP